jgi:hypothetical protein
MKEVVAKNNDSLIKPLPSTKNKIGKAKNEQSEVFRGSLGIGFLIFILCKEF